MKISGYVPFYNNASTVLAAVDSLRRQDYPLDDVFAVDDGSIDAGARILDTAGVRVLRQPSNLGRGAARARAMQEARSDLVVCCDATNVLARDFVTKAVVWFKNPSVAAVVGRFSQGAARNVAERWRGRHLFKLDVPREVKHHRLLSTHGALMRSAAAAIAGGFDPTLRHNEDGHLGARLIAGGWDVVYDPELVVTSIADNSIGQVLERYWRWYAGVDEATSWLGYRKNIVYAAKVMIVADLKARDPASAAISFLCPHYQFWKSALRRLNRNAHTRPPALAS